MIKDIINCKHVAIKLGSGYSSITDKLTEHSDIVTNNYQIIQCDSVTYSQESIKDLSPLSNKLQLSITPSLPIKSTLAAKASIKTKLNKEVT